ncbi:SAM-dependent methyltransferase [Spirosoma sp. RP8]|uniref:SAM-dependent methyltransferase n=1 Tax=Spirosoma liriopis TaxID=2937440 RepID=A0ABT0HL50_9BACT|nr:N-6 DNA methylase [Spirosoma liriopis]MCK8492900.1 SAM-dependent methyltransferase [Spirosoma liriopis]
MPKSTDVPHELRPLNKIFSENDYRWDCAEAFRDWVDFLTESFMPVRQGIYEQLKKRYGDLDWFVRMTQEWVRLQSQQIVGDNDWYDSLGTYYEILASQSKRQILGQLFTPPSLVDMMTAIQGADQSLTDKGQLVNDPCSGSGRMLLAFHAKAPGNFQFGADLDSICAKMTAVNMCIHGCVGQAVCMDSLQPDEWRFGYHINRYLNRGGGPSIEPMTGREECHSWKLWQKEKAEWAEKNKTQPDLPPPIPAAAQASALTPQQKRAEKMGQMSLF